MPTDLSQVDSSGSTRLVMLGTGTPNADPTRGGPSLAVLIDNVPYLVDCGPGCVRRAVEAGLEVTTLERLFITHLHSDHTIGYPDVLLTPAVLGRSGPLKVYGPPGTRRMTDHLLEAYVEDIRERTEGFEAGNPQAYAVDVREIETGLVYEDDRVRVSAFPVRHGTWKHAFGFRFDSLIDHRAIVISGDTVPCDELVKHAEGCDVLVHEVYSEKAFLRQPPHWQKYHRQAHTSTIELAEIANKVRPTLLVLTHVLFWGVSDQDLVDEIRAHYDGDIVLPNDLQSFRL